MGHEIYRTTDFDILPINPNISAHYPPHQVEAHLLALVRSHLHSSPFLFSYSLDLTTRMQTQWEMQEQVNDKPLWEVVRSYFAMK